MKTLEEQVHEAKRLLDQARGSLRIVLDVAERILPHVPDTTKALIRQRLEESRALLDKEAVQEVVHSCVCGTPIPDGEVVHWQGRTYGELCCWDERLRITE